MVSYFLSASLTILVGHLDSKICVVRKAPRPSSESEGDCEVRLRTR